MTGPVLVAAADERYAMPLAVMVRSAIDHLDPRRRLALFVIDGGLRARTRRLLEDSWDRGRAAVEWIRPPRDAFSGAPVHGYLSRAAYLRLLIPELLPKSLEKAIYLDSDLVVLQDLGRLWDESLESHACLGVRDILSPFVDSGEVLANFAAGRTHGLIRSPIRNYRELGLDPHAPILNTGVLVLNLSRWRDEAVAARALRCAEENRKHIWMADQYALNVVLCGAWRALDPRWNVLTAVHRFPTWEATPFSPREFEAVTRDPFILHFAGPAKPWHWGARPWRAERFHRARRATAWRGVRGLRVRARTTWDERLRLAARPVRRRLRVQRRRVREMRRAVRRARRRAAARLRRLARR